MTKDQALRLALEALEYPGPSWLEARQPAITAIKQALAQPEPEPIGEIVQAFADLTAVSIPVMPPVGTKLYAFPPKREWQGLTDDEICPWFQENTALTNEAAMRITRAIEAKLKQKNTWQDGDCKHCVNGCPACDARRQSNVLP